MEEFEELKDKIIQLRNENFFANKLDEYRDNYKQVLLSEDEYFKQFSAMMDEAI